GQRPGAASDGRLGPRTGPEDGGEALVVQDAKGRGGHFLALAVGQVRFAGQQARGRAGASVGRQVGQQLQQPVNQDAAPEAAKPVALGQRRGRRALFGVNKGRGRGEEAHQGLGGGGAEGTR